MLRRQRAEMQHPIVSINVSGHSRNHVDAEIGKRTSRSGRECERVLIIVVVQLYIYVYILTIKKHFTNSPFVHTDVRRHFAKDCRDSISEVSQLGNSVMLCLLAPCSSSKLGTSSCRKVLPWLFVFLPVWAKEEVLHRPVSVCWGGPANILNVSTYRSFGFLSCGFFRGFRATLLWLCFRWPMLVSLPQN